MAGESSRVLKANAVRELGGRVSFNFDDLQQQGQRYLAEVQAEAAALLEKTRAECEELKVQARKAGREAGLAEGLQTAQLTIEQQVAQRAEQLAVQRVKSALPALQQAAEALRAERDQWVVRWETAAIELSIAIAEKLLRTSLKADPACADAMIREALQLAAGQERVEVYLSGADLERLGDHAEEIVKSTSGCVQVRLIADAALQQGDCRIETQHGEMDASVGAMLGRIADELLGRTLNP